MAQATKIVIGVLISIFSISIVSQNAYSAQLKYTFKALDLKEYEEMEALIQRELRKRNRSANDLAAYRAQNALRILFSKRDNNGKRMTLFNDIQSQTNEASFLLAMRSLVEESVLMLSVRNLPQEKKTTYLLILENLIAEVEGYSGKFKEILEIIAKAKIKLDRRTRTYTRLAMNKVISPSKLASKALKRLNKAEKKSRKNIADTSADVNPVL